MKQINFFIIKLFLFGLILNPLLGWAQQPKFGGFPQAVPYQKRVITGNEKQTYIPSPVYVNKSFTTDVIGTTYYDLQSNSTLQNRLKVYSDGTISAVWTNASTVNYSDRGTGYNYYNAQNWNEVPNTRIEDVRTGFPVVEKWGNNGEIVVSHNGSDALCIMTRATKGTGTWTKDTLRGPELLRVSDNQTSTCLLWPAIVTVGDTIHLLAHTESDTGFYYNGVRTALLYYRSTDGGTTWDIRNKLIVDSASYQDSYSAESFQFISKDGVLAIVYTDTWQDWYVLKSVDAGETWSKINIYENPYRAKFNKEICPLAYHTDGKPAVAIDKNGNLISAVGVIYCYDSIPDDNKSYTYYPRLSEGLIVWKESDGLLTTLDPDTLQSQGHQVFFIPEIIGDSTILLLSSLSLPSYSSSLVSAPQIAVHNDGTIVMTYASILDYLYYSGTSYFHYNGIFAVKSDDNALTWSEPSMLSYGDDWLDFDILDLYPETTNPDSAGLPVINVNFAMECFYTALAKDFIDDDFVILFQSREAPGTNVHSSVDNTGNNLQSYMYSIRMDKDDIGVYNKLPIVEPLGVCTNEALTQTKIYPNPAQERAIIEITSYKEKEATLNIVNILGQSVYAENLKLNTGSNRHIINLSHLTSGVYLININAEGDRYTQKIIVK